MTRAPRVATVAGVPPALEDAALERLAGAAVFARGLAYAREGRCLPVRQGAAASEWIVRGSDSYRTTLALAPDGLQADCTCPYADDGGTCKHVVAAAVAWRAQLAGEAPQPSATGADPLRQFLQARPAAELTQRLLAWADRDRTLRAELKAWRAQEEAGLRPDGWKAAVDEALRKTRDFYDEAASRDYARRGEMLLPLLQQLTLRDPQAARAACVMALRRIFRVGEHADDSAGRIGDLLHTMHAVLVEAVRVRPPAGPEAQRWLRTWLQLQEVDPWGLWDDTAMLEAAGAEFRAQYSRQLARDWTDWLERRGNGGDAIEAWDSVRFRVRSRYLADRRLHGDAEAVLAALRDDQRGAHEVLELAAQLEAMGREREALQHLEAGARQFHGDHRLEDALLLAYERDGCHEECLAIRRARLERHPDVARYVAALLAAQAAGRDAAAYRLDLYRWAEQREGKPQPFLRFARRGAEALRDVSVRLRWLLHDGKPAEALALARTTGHGAAQDVLRELARATAPLELDAADAIWRELVEARMRRAQAPYREELDLAAEWLHALEPVRRAERLAWLRAAYKAKRNFIAGLEKLFPG